MAIVASRNVDAHPVWGLDLCHGIQGPFLVGQHLFSESCLQKISIAPGEGTRGPGTHTASGGEFGVFLASLLCPETAFLV